MALRVLFAVVGAVRGDVAARVSGAVVRLGFRRRDRRFERLVVFSFSQIVG